MMGAEGIGQVLVLFGLGLAAGSSIGKNPIQTISLVVVAVGFSIIFSN